MRFGRLTGKGDIFLSIVFNALTAAEHVEEPICT